MDYDTKQTINKATEDWAGTVLPKMTVNDINRLLLNQQVFENLYDDLLECPVIASMLQQTTEGTEIRSIMKVARERLWDLVEEAND